MKTICRWILFWILSISITLLPTLLLVDLKTIRSKLNIIELLYFILGMVLWIFIVVVFLFWLLIDIKE